MIEGEKDFGVKSKLILASVVGLWDYAMPIAKLALKYKEFVCGVDIGNDFIKKLNKIKKLFFLKNHLLSFISWL